jgi:hypothetical protein
MAGDSDEGVAAAGAFGFFGAISDLPCLYRLVRQATLGVPAAPSRAWRSHARTVAAGC